MELRASLSAILLLSALFIAAVSCQPSAGDRLLSSVASPTPEIAQTRIVEEIIKKVETEEGVEIHKTVREYAVTPAPPLEELVKIQKVETDDQVEITKIEILPGFGLRVDRPGSTPRPPQISFCIVVTSRNKGPASTIRTQITIEDPSIGEKHTTGVDEFVDSGGTTGPYLGFHVEQKRWVAHVEVRVIPWAASKWQSMDLYGQSAFDKI